MKKINDTLFELDVIIETMSHGKTFGLLLSLKDIKIDLIDIRESYINAMEFSEVLFIDKQLDFINKNIRTFEDALTYHEANIFHKTDSIGDLGTFCLN